MISWWSTVSSSFQSQIGIVAVGALCLWKIEFGSILLIRLELLHIQIVLELCESTWTVSSKYFLKTNMLRGCSGIPPRHERSSGLACSSWCISRILSCLQLEMALLGYRLLKLLQNTTHLDCWCAWARLSSVVIDDVVRCLSLIQDRARDVLRCRWSYRGAETCQLSWSKLACSAFSELIDRACPFKHLLFDVVDFWRQVSIWRLTFLLRHAQSRSNIFMRFTWFL